jgi:DNA processing protein
MHPGNEGYLQRLIALWSFPGVGPVALSNLKDRDPSLLSFFNHQKFSAALYRFLKCTTDVSPNWPLVNDILHWRDVPGNALLTWDDPAYPVLLKETHGAPPLLFIQGNLTALSFPQIAVVGTRKATPKGLQQAFEFSKVLAEQGVTITSGLALGIDTQAHLGALAVEGGISIAVLAGGLANLYPRQNCGLAKRILSNQGALISELPPKQFPLARDFARRNRIVSGLSSGVLVVEAPIKSGALITAQFALDQNRDVFAMAGFSGSRAYEGCHHLIKEGAQLVDTPDDILANINFNCLSVSHKGGGCQQQSESRKSRSLEKTKENEQMDVLTPFEQAVQESIGWETTSIDWVVDQTGLSIQQVNLALGTLMLSGLITLVPGGYAKVPR